MFADNHFAPLTENALNLGGGAWVPLGMSDSVAERWKLRQFNVDVKEAHHDIDDVADAKNSS